MKPSEDGPADASGARVPLFVERQTYRRRRIRDAIRALPALGVLLWMVPLLWPYGTEPMQSSGALLFLFGVWFALVVLAGALVAILNRGDQEAARAANEAAR